MVEELITGLEKNQMFMKDNLKEEKGMEEEHFGGVMEAGMKGNSEKVFKVAMVAYIVKED